MAKDYYQILGLRKDALDEDIKRAYRRLALKYHPDKNKSAGADEKFKEIGEAYEVLIDKRRRNIYDLYGSEGLRRRAPSYGEPKKRCPYAFHGDPKATFAQFFGGTNPFQNLFDFGCGGSGLFTFHSDNMTVDDPFKGFGAYDLRHGNIRPKNFVRENPSQEKTQSHQDPPIEHDLHVSLEDILNGCTKKVKISRVVIEEDGKMKKEDKIFIINVKKGWKAGTKIIFQKEGDRRRNRIPADVVFILKEKPHPFFKRDDSDITYMARISLKEALCGGIIEVPSLENNSIRLNLSNEVVKPGSWKRLVGHGLPFPRDSSKRGDLIVTFEIKFPEYLSFSVRNILIDVLPDEESEIPDGSTN